MDRLLDFILFNSLHFHELQKSSNDLGQDFNKIQIL